jgi:hypothetical protein
MVRVSPLWEPVVVSAGADAQSSDAGQCRIPAGLESSAGWCDRQAGPPAEPE